MGEREWTDWIEHDGAAPPRNPSGTLLQVALDLTMGLHLIQPPDVCDFATWPGCFWRRKRVRTGWFKTELRRICDDPAYAPIKRYRLQKPRSIEVDRLAEIAADPYAPPPVVNPEGPSRLPKRVPA